MMRPFRRAAAVLAALSCPCLAQEAEQTSGPEIDAAIANAPRAEAVSAPSPAKSLVAYALLPASVEGGVIREAMVGRMVDAVVMTVTAKPDTVSAWRSLVRPEDRVGIKISTTGAPVSSTHAAVVAAVAGGLAAAGVDAKNIVIWDRSAHTVALGGYEALARRYRVTSTQESGGYDPKAKIVAAMMGKLNVDDLLFNDDKGDNMSSTSHVSSVLSGVDKVIHVPALADSMYAGVQGALSGVVLDNLDNWRRLARQPHHGDPYLPELYADPRLGGKVVITILDALRPQYAGGPFAGAEFSVNYGAIFASRDPVALDATGMRLLDDFRKDAKLDSLAKKTAWLATAEALGLGRAADEKIELVRTGLEGEVRMEKSP